MRFRGYCKSCSGCTPASRLYNRSRQPHGVFGAATARAKSGSTTSMKQKSISTRSLGNCLALLIMLLGASFREQARGLEQDSASALELAKQIHQEAASAELQVTLAGNLKDFSIASGEVSSDATRRTQQSQVGAAAASFREALKNSPDNAELHFDLSLALARLGDSGAAQVELDVAIRSDPNMAKAYNQLGIWHIRNNEKAKAGDAFKAAISADSQFVEAKNNLGVLYACSGKDLDAIELFRAAIQGRPSRPMDLICRELWFNSPKRYGWIPILPLPISTKDEFCLISIVSRNLWRNSIRLAGCSRTTYKLSTCLPRL